MRPCRFFIRNFLICSSFLLAFSKENIAQVKVNTSMPLRELRRLSPSIAISAKTQARSTHPNVGVGNEGCDSDAVGCDQSAEGFLCSTGREGCRTSCAAISDSI
jgi:hypothetical protein